VKLIAGVDGGENSTVAAIADEAGHLLGRASYPHEHFGGVRGFARHEAAVLRAVAAARAAANIIDASPFEAVAVGLPRFDEAMALALNPIAKRVAVMQDAEIAHVGALGGKPGIVVFAGTGSVALGTAPGVSTFVRAGGWGNVFGDEGSAFWIGREAIRSAMSAADRGEPSRLHEAALSFFQVPTLHALQQAYAQSKVTPSHIAAFARVTLDLASQITDPPGAMDGAAFHTRTHAAHHLTELAMVVDARLPTSSERYFSYGGSLFADMGLRDKFAWMLEMRRSAALERARCAERTASSKHEYERYGLSPARLPQLGPIEPIGEPFEGAIILARHLARSSTSKTCFTSDDVLEQFPIGFASMD